MDTVLFIAFPYLAVVLAIGVSIYRHARRPYTYSSLSSQILERRKLFWGSVPFHYGLTVILLAHILPAIFPGTAGWLLGNELRRLVLEVTGIAIALYTFFGLIVLIIRRIMPGSLAHVVTTYMDGIILFALLIQIGSGLAVALFNRWGGLWYLHTAVPWFWSLVALHPDIRTVVFLPPFVKLHFVFGFVVILLIPFSRLVHLIALPIQYLWRPYQVAVWNRLPRKSATYSSKERTQ